MISNTQYQTKKLEIIRGTRRPETGIGYGENTVLSNLMALFVKSNTELMIIMGKLKDALKDLIRIRMLIHLNFIYDS